MSRVTRFITALALTGVLYVTGCGPAMISVGAGDPYYHYRRPVTYFDVAIYPYNGYWHRDHVYYDGYWYWHGWNTPFYDYYWVDDPYWYW